MQFNHPYEHPYTVQIELMNEIQKTLENPYKLGIFESPTGTGKTLSLICSTMTWLRNEKLKVNNHLVEEKLKENDAESDGDEPEWVKSAYRNKILVEYLENAKKYELYLDDVSNQGTVLVKEVKSKGNFRLIKKRKIANETAPLNPEIDIESLAPDDYDINENDITASGMSHEVESLLKKVETQKNHLNEKNIKSTVLNESKLKIYFVSRTHSQLSQFCDQLKMTKFPPSINSLSAERTKYLPLGSRKQLCINEAVLKLGDLPSINKECQNLQTSNEKKSCQYFPALNANDDEMLLKRDRLNDLIMADIHDIEDIGRLGSKLGVCPYYSTRNNIPLAEIISMPYQLLLNKDTRHILGLDLSDSVIIIDEAHNLLDTISMIYSSSISFEDLKLIKKSLKLYTKKFFLKMSAGNRINIAKLNKIIGLLHKFMEKSFDAGTIKNGDIIERDYIFNEDLTDLLNIYELENYLVQSKLAFKLESYTEKIFKEKYISSGQPLLFKVKTFLYSLSNPLKNGKFFWDQPSKDSNFSIKYLLLDPSEDFKDLIDESKCVILAGGTMEPISDFTEFLVPYLKHEKINHFSCDHVIPDENLLVYPIGTSLNGSVFEFSFQKRNELKQILELGCSFIELLKNIPDGVVSFFPSYKYLLQVTEVWKNRGIFDEMNKIKKIFWEEKDQSVEVTLNAYKECIELKESNGAFLLSVVGGKMSEGINFSDELARAVFMVGLPYPNAFSSDLIAKREFIEKKYLDLGHNIAFAKSKSHEYYENLCMKSINQSVGRAIRNINDYAIIYLFDQRYTYTKIQQKLSKWVRKRVQTRNLSLAAVVAESSHFFKKKN